MPLDTRSKRASALSALRPWVLTPVAPDGTLSQGDRQHAAFMYSGILASPAVIVEEFTIGIRSLVAYPRVGIRTLVSYARVGINSLRSHPR